MPPRMKDAFPREIREGDFQQIKISVGILISVTGQDTIRFDYGFISSCALSASLLPGQTVSSSFQMESRWVMSCFWL